VAERESIEAKAQEIAAAGWGEEKAFIVPVLVQVDERIGPDAEIPGHCEDPAEFASRVVAEQVDVIPSPHNWDHRLGVVRAVGAAERVLPQPE
jgi:hypothetical protein